MLPYAVIAGDLGIFVEAICDTLYGAGAAVANAVRPRAAALKVDIAEGADAMPACASMWRALETAGGAATAFQTLALARACADAHLGRGEKPRIVTVREHGRPAVVFPTVISRIGGFPVIRFLGDPLIQYGDVIASPDASPAALAAAFQAAADPAQGALMMLRRVRADARIAPLLQRRGTAVAEQSAPFVDIEAVSNANARDQRELRRFRRRLAEAGNCRFEILTGADAQSAAREALALKRGWLAERGMPSSVIGDAAWEDAIIAIAAHPEPMRVARLTVAGRTAAVEIGLVHDRHWLAFVGARAPEFNRLGPGHVQMADTIAACRDSGIAFYDLLPPDDAYKSAMAHGAVTVRDHAIALTPTGRIGLATAPLLPAVKRLVARMPSGLRRAMVAGLLRRA